ncbi:MAG: hypothetical protein MPL62_07190 [Alphaproteobacteria bacterium]|nr:hypothetical protein [Alphaproteobacteria bacterium]
MPAGAARKKLMFGDLRFTRNIKKGCFFDLSARLERGAARLSVQCFARNILIIILK